MAGEQGRLNAVQRVEAKRDAALAAIAALERAEAGDEQTPAKRTAKKSASKRA